MKAKKRVTEKKAAMRGLATARCVFLLETTGIRPETTVYRCEGYKSSPQRPSQEIVGQKN